MLNSIIYLTMFYVYNDYISMLYCYIFEIILNIFYDLIRIISYIFTSTYIFQTCALPFSRIIMVKNIYYSLLYIIHGMYITHVCNLEYINY